MRARSKGTTGFWIIGGFVLLVAMCRGGKDDHRKPDNTPAAPVATSSQLVQAPIAEPAEPMYVAANSLNQRSAPNGTVVDKSTGGESVHVYERRNGWARITPTGSPERWVSSKLLCSGAGCYMPKPKPRTNYQPARSLGVLDRLDRGHISASTEKAEQWMVARQGPKSASGF